jgi:hypothetical protein
MTTPGQAPVASVAEAAERSHFALRRAVVDVAMGLLHAGCCLSPPCGLADLAGEHVTITSPAGVNPHLKIPCLVAGMAAGADSIDDMDVLRHGAMTEIFGGFRAPSTLGRSCGRSPGQRAPGGRRRPPAAGVAGVGCAGR